MRWSRALVCACAGIKVNNEVRSATKKCDFLNMLITTLHNPSTAENFVSAVEHCCLSGGYCSLGFDELDMRVVVRERCNRRRRRGVTITHAYFGLQRFAWIVEGNPIHACGHELIAQQFFLLADDDAVSVRIDSDRKSTRLNSSHEWISYAVFCLKKK